MKIGLAYDLREDMPLNQSQPDDALEEYDSRETVAGIAAALESLGHSVVLLGGGREFLTHIVRNNLDFVFNIAEGRGNYPSREAQVPAILEMLGVPYSGSDPQCLSICLDKPLTKKLVMTAGVRTPRWQVITQSQQLCQMSGEDFLFPAFIKPAYEGSSKGIRFASRVENAEGLLKATHDLLERYQQPVMVEEFITGDEVTVGVIGNAPPTILGVMRILPKEEGTHFVYSLETKRNWKSLVDYECPARLEPDIQQQITSSSLNAFQVLGCRDFARLDFRVSPEGMAYFLEINPLPGLNPKSSDLIIMARKMSWTYQSLLSAILDAALQRYPQCVPG